MKHCASCGNKIFALGLSRNNKIYCGLRCFHKENKTLKYFEQDKDQAKKTIFASFKVIFKHSLKFNIAFFIMAIFLMASLRKIDIMAILMLTGVTLLLTLIFSYTLANLFCAIKYKYTFGSSLIDIIVREDEPVRYYCYLVCPHLVGFIMSSWCLILLIRYFINKF